MTTTFCDVCGKATIVSKRIVHEAGICGGYNACREIDICLDCSAELNSRIAKLEHEFIKEYKEKSGQSQ